MANESETAKLIYGRRLATGPLSPSRVDPGLPGSTRNAPPIPSARRLLVLLPELYFLDHPRLAAHLRELAEEAGATITLLALAEREQDEMLWAHRLESFAAIIRSNRVPTEVVLECGDNWHRAIQANWQSGDLIVSPMEHTVKTGIFHRTRVLCQVIVEDLHKTVYAISF